MKPALIVVDMLKDTFEKHPDSFIAKEAVKFVPTMNMMASVFRQNGFPVIFACDSFLSGDFIFNGKMKPHSIRNTKGAQVIDDLNRESEDIILEKRRFSAFFKTDLDQTLRTLGVDTAVVTGIATHVCVLTTALDALASDFNAVILKDCCAAHRQEYHDAVVNTYERGFIAPLFKINTSEEFLKEL